MDGARPAAEGRHNEYASAMADIGFIVRSSSACAFYHPELCVASSVYGDDFTTIGPKSSLDVFASKLRKRHELKEAARFGPAASDDKEGRILNRIARWTTMGLEHEADPRQAEKLVEELACWVPILETCYKLMEWNF